MKVTGLRWIAWGKLIRLATAGSMLIGLLTETALLAVEEPKYRVLESQDPFEIRQYQPQVVAETLVDGDFDSAGEEGFRRLFYYIAGHNRLKQTGPMTAPVSPEVDTMMIPMTAPIFQEKAGNKYRIFLPMPQGSTLQNLPEPADPRVRLKELPGRLVAATWYSGAWGEEGYLDRKTKLLQWARRHGLNITGEPIYARYDSAYIWFLRRNEVLIPIEKYPG